MSDEARKDVVYHDKYSFVHTLHLDPLRREAITFGARLAHHGDQLGEHGMAGKMGNLYEASGATPVTAASCAICALIRRSWSTASTGPNAATGSRR